MKLAETNFTLYSSVETLFEIYRILRIFYQLDSLYDSAAHEQSQQVLGN